MAKIDLKAELKHLYAPSGADFSVVDVPPMRFLMIDGHGDPNTAPAYAQAVEALYAVAYALKFACKAETGADYVVPPLEGLWWADAHVQFTTQRDKSTWSWTMMLAVPDVAPAELLPRASAEAARKKALPALPALRMETYHEGLSVQILHTGSYDDETPVLARLHGTWMPQHGYAENGKHHEIYLSDPRKTAPEKLKTVLRQPIRPV